MDYKLYKFKFQSAVHFGKQNLDDGEYSCCADTIFSALSQEALRLGEDVLKCFYQYVKDGELLFSDTFPYMGDTYFLPKPMKRIEMPDRTGDSVIKKKFKKLTYIEEDMFDTYLQGKYDILQATDMGRLGQFVMKEAASIRGEEETQPYRIGIYYYKEGNGIYVIVGYQEKKALELTEKLLENLSFSGIGGKRASGLGRFDLHSGKLSSSLLKRLKGVGNRYMSLSTALPKDDELKSALNGAEYLLLKRSGFVLSERYAPEQMRKKDLYTFRAGSCFSARFSGDIYDVSCKGGSHPVYRYAKPLFVEVDG